MYSILIKNENDSNLFSFYKTKVEDKEVTTEEVVDEETGEVKTVKKEVGLGTFSTKIFTTDDPKIFENECKKLLRTYNLNQLKFIRDLDYDMDILWSDANIDEAQS